jgi:hypothetical protein
VARLRCHVFVEWPIVSGQRRRVGQRPTLVRHNWLLLLRNSRKTVAVSGAPPEGPESSFVAWWRASAPFALLFATTLGTTAALSFADVHNSDPSEWTGPEVYQVLNNSPWAKTLKVDVPAPADNFGSQNTGNTASNAGALPPGAGGMGRRGMGGGRAQRTYSSGGASGNSNSSARSGPTEVTIQWQSALVVRMAAAKKAALKEMEYRGQLEL